MENKGSLAGKEIAFTGRLLSMPRSEAVERVVHAGGRHVLAPGSTTALLVAGPALGHITSAGAMARNLVRFKELKEEGASIRLVEETEFLRMLGADEDLADLAQLYTATQVSRIIERPLSEIRSWLRHGLLQPARMTNRLPWFEFRDIILARNLSRLSAAGVSTSEIRRSFSLVAHWLPDAQWVLGRLDAAEFGLKVRMNDGGWAEPSGQRLLNFDPEPHVATVPTPFPADNQNAAFWFACALEAEEEGELHAAVIGYKKSLAESPDVLTWFNLGNVYYDLGQEAEAGDSYLSALAIDQDFAEAWNNLGNALAALGKLEDSTRAYDRALRLEPGYADAHCNLAQALERLGRSEEAAAHRAACVKAFPSETRLRLLREPFTDDSER